MTEENTSNIDVVIVEDQPDLGEIYKTRLELFGFTSVLAGDGIQALVEIEKHKPRLVLLDLMLPKLSGDQVLKVMRSTEWGEDIKVLIISNLNESEAPAGLRDLGIEGYLVKANMTDGQLDKIVGTILKPIGQSEDVSALEGNGQS
ncbi:MAG TPA: response regulator [Verrucomicrobiae bacterium]|nr:response regulator [Verrucomicrobiae bacterium]